MSTPLKAASSALSSQRCSSKISRRRGSIFGVNMLLHTDVGDVFTYREISGWLAESGFKDARRLEAPAPSPLILATKP